MEVDEPVETDEPVAPVEDAVEQADVEAEVVEDAVEQADVEAEEVEDAVEQADVEAEVVEEASVTAPEPELTEAEVDYEAHLEQRDAEVDPIEFAAPPRRPRVTPPAFSALAGGAEQMSPDPVVDDGEMGSDVDLIESLEGEAPLAAADDEEGTQEAFVVPSYLRSNSDTLFGGQSVADDLARRGPRPGPEDIDLGEDARPDVDEPETVKAPRLRLHVAACGWSCSASSPSSSVRACSSPSICCGSGTTSLRWCCRCSSSSGSSSACAWFARPRTSAARSSRWRLAPWSHWDPWSC